MPEPLSPADGLQTLRTAAWAPLERGWIAVTGPDRVRWLNGMVTNSVQALTPGQGAYTFLLNAQGRIQGDATVWCSSEDLLLLETDPAQTEPLIILLDRFIIMDDVELADVSAEWHSITLIGTTAPDSLKSIGLPVPSSMTKLSNQPWQSHTLSIVQAQSPVVPRFELWSRDSAALVALTEALNLPQVPAESLELLRILEATPRFGTDIRDKDLPQETAQTRALHFNKGCYLGQEIVERIRSRGQVHRTFTQFVLTGGHPAPGAELTAEGKPVGTLTSIAAEPIDGLRLALGYVRREAVERKLPLHYDWNGAGGAAAVRPEAPAANPASNA